MTWLEGALVVVAGMGAGVINTVVGSGTLITFPVLLSTGLAPVAANVANNVGASLCWPSTSSERNACVCC